MKIKINSNGLWYHGSNKIFDTLAAGSTITQWQELAEAFSHKPKLLFILKRARFFTQASEKAIFI